MNDTVNDRIKFLIDSLYNRNVSAFSRATEIKQSTLNTILGERKSKPSFDVLNAIALKAKINPNWLLTGLGDMRDGQEDENIDAEIEAVMQKLASEGTTVGGSVPYEFVQQLFREREAHDQIILSQQKTIETQQKTIEQLTSLIYIRVKK